jgi:hypothetical protein
MTRIAIVSGYDDTYAEIGGVAVANHIAYAARNGYDYLLHRQGFDTSRAATWSKILFLQQHLAHYDWLFWFDADALFMRHDIRLESFLDERYDMLISGENAGVFFLRCDKWASDFLAETWGQTQFLSHFWQEGEAIAHLFRTQPWVCERRKEVPWHSFNSYLADYVPGDFVLHLAGVGPTLGHRAQLLRQYAQEIQVG